MKKSGLMGVVLVGMAALAGAQNYNNGEDLAKFVTSESFASMKASELKPIRDKVSKHIQQCVNATIVDLRKNPPKEGVNAVQLQRYYQAWQPFHKVGCEMYATEQSPDGVGREDAQLRCEVFAQSSLYSDVLGYQTQALSACNTPEQ